MPSNKLGAIGEGRRPGEVGGPLVFIWKTDSAVMSGGTFAQAAASAFVSEPQLVELGTPTITPWSAVEFPKITPTPRISLDCTALLAPPSSLTPSRPSTHPPQPFLPPSNPHPHTHPHLHIDPQPHALPSAYQLLQTLSRYAVKDPPSVSPISALKNMQGFLDDGRRTRSPNPLGFRMAQNTAMGDLRNISRSGSRNWAGPTSGSPPFEIDSFVSPANPYLTGDRESNIQRLSELLSQSQQDHEFEYLLDFGPTGISANAHRFCSEIAIDLRRKVHGLQGAVSELQSQNARYAFSNNNLQSNLNNIIRTLPARAPMVPEEKEVEFKRMSQLVQHIPAIITQNHGYVQEITALRARLISHGIDPDISPDTSTAAHQSTKFPSNGYFGGEFGILFRSFGNLGRCNYQFTKQVPFPANVSVPTAVRERLKSIVQGDVQLLDWLLDDANKTKFLLVAGLFARLINSEVMVEGFIDKLLVEMREPPARKMEILDGYCKNVSDVVLKVAPALTTKAEAMARNLHDRYVSLLSRPTDARHLEESHRALVNYIEHAGRLSIQIAQTGYQNWRFIFMETGNPFSSSKMTTCDEGSEGLVNGTRDDRILEANGTRIRFCVFPMVARKAPTGGEVWDIIAKASVFA